MATQMQQRQAPKMSTRADFMPASIDEEARTFEIVFATSTPVRRGTWSNGWEEFDEVLGFKPSNIRMERLKNGAPFLKDHWPSVDNTIGVITDAWIENGEGRARVKLADTESAAEVLQKIKDGILRNVSVGYRVHKYKKEDKKEGQDVPIYRAVDWEPHEVSLVAIPADPKSQFRSEEGYFSVTIENEEMEQQTPTTPLASGQVDTEAIKVEAAKAERERCAAITELCRKFQLDAEFERALINDGKSIGDANSAVLAKLSEQSGTRGIVNTPKDGEFARPKSDEPSNESKKREAVALGMALRSGLLQEGKLNADQRALVGEANQYREKRLLDMAKMALRNGGMSYSDLERMSDMEIAKRAITSSTSDFPILLQNTANILMLDAYNTQSDTWRQFCAVGSVSDFKIHKRLRMGSFGDLSEVNENGEYSHLKLDDASYEKVQIKTKGNLVNLSRQMIINDDLMGFARTNVNMGRSAARSIENDVYAFLALNSGDGGNLSDNLPIFHASRNNILAAAALTTAHLDAARQLMAQQKEKNGNDFIGLIPEIAVCGLDKYGQLIVLNDAQFEPGATNSITPNISRGLFQRIVSTPRIAQGTSYFYMFASPMADPIVEVSFLNGVQAPYMEMQEAFNQDGVTYKVRLDYGVSGVGYRGAVKVNIS